MAQFVEPLRERGIELTISPFLNRGQFHLLYKGRGFVRKAFGMIGPLLGRIREIVEIHKYDLIFVQREAMIFGPGIFEWLFRKIGNIPMVLDLDDATYISYVSPRYGRLGSAFKFFGKTDNLIRHSAAVVCGNRFIAEHAESLGAHTVIVPTVVDTALFHPFAKTNAIPVIGWIGTHSTYPFLESLFPVLERLASKHRFVLRVVGAGRDDVLVKGVDVDNRNWSLEREAEDFRTLDIGLYPMSLSDSAKAEWLLGKSGFKAIQYMAVGVPFVMSPVGVGAEIGEAGNTHFTAESEEEWFPALDHLLGSASHRIEMGAKGREFALKHYTIDQQADKIGALFREVLRSPVT